MRNFATIPLNEVTLQIEAKEAVPNEAALRALTRRMVEGEDPAWVEFHKRYYLSLLRYTVSRCGSPDDASEIVQQVYLRVARHLKEFGNESELWRWLACVVRCAVVDHQRGIRRRAALLERFAHWQEGQQTVELPDPVEIHSRANDALAELPADDSELLRLKYYNGWSVKEIAANTESTPKAVENRLARLREHLRKIILETR